MSSTELYKQWQEYAQKNAEMFNRKMAKFLLTLPIPMSYELWTYLHEYADKEVK